MSSPKNEFAFPSDTFDPKRTGMTLRDYFAAKASEEDIQAHIMRHQKTPTPKSWEVTREQAKYAYADAMLEARAK